MQPKCSCRKEIAGWYFNFDKEETKFDRNDAVGEHLITLMRALKVKRNGKRIKISNTFIINALHRVETEQKLRLWFLNEVKKQTHKPCFGWQCRIKIVKHNKKCKIHGNKLITKKEKK